MPRRILVEIVRLAESTKFNLKLVEAFYSYYLRKLKEKIKEKTEK